jgi:ornithine cyclodeaminase/alanine dehydrogenase
MVAKLNTNFPGNRAQFGLPTIQGVIALYDAENGLPVAILDSIDITIKRTAAASAVAAKYLARRNSVVGTICGCGQQARAQLHAILTILPIKKIFAFDLDEPRTKKFATDISEELTIEVKPVRDPASAIRESDICVTCTTSRQFFVHKQDVAPGTFIAAVGADHADKQEIDPALMVSAKVVTDSLEQCCAIGDLHHAIAQNLLRKEDVHAELSEIVAGHKPGRINEEEIIIFDSTGVAMEDAVAAAVVFEKARAVSAGSYFNFAA